MKFKKYVFRKYSKEYPKLFEKEKGRISRMLTQDTKIEHVGSTAVPGLGGKGIIDIAIKTPKNKLKQFMKKLDKLGYKPVSEHQPNDKRIFFQKMIKYRGKERHMHVHLTLNNDFWDTFISFRDYLRNHSKERSKYAKIKKEAVRHARGEGQKYRDYKHKTLEKLGKLALKEYKK